MKIKKVSITGFKSFVEKLDLSLPEGISAIVGPNGCGKSNIVDAIRWAMGEQSAKQLRGRQMEDVIFNGAGDARPLGMAEVSLVFENGDGSFPGEFVHETELAVTRRLYRSGESEYLINKVPCRLKDIQEVFMDTGLGNRAYSIISQGQIGFIIDQRPEDTRAMLEEAAGITKYRKKVEETRRKLESTKGNLQRVEDILGEVQRQMNALKRQAAKARRFKSLGQEIQKHELLLHAHAYHELKEESGNRRKSTESLLQEEIARSTAFAACQATIETMNLELDDMDRKMASLRQTYERFKDKAGRKESLLESIAGEKRMQQEMESRLTREKEDLGTRLEGLQKEKDPLIEKIQKIRESSSALEGDLSLFEERLKSKGQLLQEAREEYEQTRARVNSGITKEMGLNQESGYLNTRIGEIRENRARLENEKREVGEKVGRILDVSKKKTEIREALVGKSRDIEEDISGTGETLDELERMKKAVEMDLKLAEADMNVYQSRLLSLRSLADNFEGYKIGVRTIMKANDLEARKDGRIKGLVAEILQVEPDYEQAIEAVLSDKLQYVIVETQSDGKEAVEYLKARAKGKSSFIPLLDIHGNGTGKGNCNGHPLLRNLVTVPEEYKPLLDALLGDTILVEDLDQAISEWKINGKDHSLVTRDGDMVDKSGVISGGKLGSSSVGLLGRKREMKELEAQITACNKKIAGLKDRLETLAGDMEEKETRRGILKEERSRSQEKLNEIDKHIFQISHELDQLEKLSARIGDELEKKSREEDRHGENLGRIQSEIILWREKIKQEEEYLEQKKRELKEAEEEFEDYRNELSKLKMTYNLSQEEERGMKREIERIDQFTEEAREKMEKIDQEVVSARENYRICIKREEGLRGELVEAQQELYQAKEALSSAELARNEMHSKIKEEEKRAETGRGEIEVLRENINTAKLEQSEVGYKMDSLVQVVREKTNLHLPDIYQEYLQGNLSPVEVRERIERQKKLRERLGEVNLTAIQEHEALKERYSFISTQREDLLHSIESLNRAIRKINQVSLEKFMETFQEVDGKLKGVFSILFNGGTAGLKLVDETNPLESGVLVQVHPPGKKVSHMGLLSGGEKALVAMALLFSIYLIKPSPFCLLDEVDAPLDEANIDRFNNLLKEIRKYSQIILVTHNRRSMEIVDKLYGVTMEKAGVSKIVSVDLQGLERN